MTSTRIAGVAVCLAAVVLFAGATSGILPITWIVLVTSIPVLLVVGCYIALGRRWALIAGRVALWLLVIVSAVLIVPDREEAVHGGDPGLQWRFAFFAGYLLVCIVLVGQAARAAKNAISERSAS